MSSNKLISAILFVAAAAFAFSLSSSRALGPVQGVHQGVPPKELNGASRGPSVWWQTEDIKATMRFHMHDMNVVISWSHSGEALGTAEGASSRQLIALPYYPTCAIRYDDAHIMVAGKIDSGRTVIEKMRIIPPKVVRDFSTGEISLNGAHIRSREYVYASGAAGRDMVHFMKRMITPREDLLVRFWDSKDVYRLKMPDKSLHLVASATAGQGGLHIPEADADYINVRTGVHTDLGNVYIFYQEPGSSYVASMVLIDGEGDGVVESSLVPDLAAWRSYNLGDAGHYLDW